MTNLESGIKRQRISCATGSGKRLTDGTTLRSIGKTEQWVIKNLLPIGSGAWQRPIFVWLNQRDAQFGEAGNTIECAVGDCFDGNENRVAVGSDTR